MPSEVPASAIADALELAAKSPIVIVGLINEEELSVARALAKAGHQLVLLSLGRPTLLDAGVEGKGTRGHLLVQPSFGGSWSRDSSW